MPACVPTYIHIYTHIHVALYHNTVLELGIDIASSFCGMAVHSSLPNQVLSTNRIGQALLNTVSG